MDATEYISLSQAAKLPSLKRNGRHPDITTIWRWASRGVRGGIKLKSWIIGGSRVTTSAAIEEFLAELNGGAEPTAPASRKQRAANAKKRLAAAGI